MIKLLESSHWSGKKGTKVQFLYDDATMKATAIRASNDTSKSFTISIQKDKLFQFTTGTGTFDKQLEDSDISIVKNELGVLVLEPKVLVSFS